MVHHWYHNDNMRVGRRCGMHWLFVFHPLNLAFISFLNNECDEYRDLILAGEYKEMHFYMSTRTSESVWSWGDCCCCDGIALHNHDHNRKRKHGNGTCTAAAPAGQLVNDVDSFCARLFSLARTYAYTMCHTWPWPYVWHIPSLILIAPSMPCHAMHMASIYICIYRQPNHIQI